MTFVPLGPCPNCGRDRPIAIPSSWRQVDHPTLCLNWVTYSDGTVKCDGLSKETLMISESTCVGLVKSLADGPCSCVYPMARGSWGVDPKTGEATHSYDPGPKRTCLRCLAREALAADGVTYVSDNRVRFTVTL